MLSCRADQGWTPAGFTRVEDRESTGGVLAALTNAWASTDADVLTVLAIDLPNVRSEWLERMAGIARDEDVSVVPFHENRFEPLAAAWHRSAVAVLGEALAAGRSFQDVCAELKSQSRLHVFEPAEAVATVREC